MRRSVVIKRALIVAEEPSIKRRLREFELQLGDAMNEEAEAEVMRPQTRVERIGEPKESVRFAASMTFGLLLSFLELEEIEAAASEPTVCMQSP